MDGIITLIKILALIVSIISIGISIWYALEINSLHDQDDQKRREHFSIHADKKLSPNRIRWEGIAAQFKTNDPNLWRIAIIDADAMLDEMVSAMGYEGKSFGERLKHMQREGIAWTDAAWDVHLLRNKLAHEGSAYPLNDREAYRAYRIYENLFESNGYLA